MTSDQPVLTRGESAALIAKVTEALYIAHVNSGKAYLSIGHAVEIAATIVGAVQSDEVMRLVEDAAADPTRWLNALGARRRALNDRVDSDVAKKVEILAASMGHKEASENK